jgi:alanyl-tRNA synthetase
MRRIMRRAIRHGRKLGFDDLFLDRACEAVVETMGAAYPELLEARTLVVKVAENEEKAFRRTLDVGLKVLSRFIDRARARGSETLGGADAFKLKDTYGFPPDLTEIIAGEHGLTFDHEGFARELSKPRGAGGDTPGGEAVAEIHKALAGRLGELKFVGYTHEEEPLEQHEGHWRRRGRYLEVETTVRALLQQGAEVQAVEDGEVEVILDPTPFYGEAGGQVGDRGAIVGDSDLSLEVLDSQKPLEGLTVSRCRILDGRVSVGQSVWAGYDPQVRKQTRAHHSATHLLHASLRQVLGDHVKQQGSLVDPDHLRFDYAHFEPPTLDQLRAVEEEVNSRVAKSDPVVTEVLPFDEARQKGAIALFGEKYGDLVRVVTMGKSIEFCGGTHVRSTSDIGIVLITNEELVASGIRRIEAEVSDAALLRARRTASMLARAVATLQNPNEPQADTDQSILMALVKATRTYHQLIQDLASEEIAAVELPEQKVSAPRLGNEPTVDKARAVRDLWQGVVAMANARASETDTIRERFAAMDPGHLLERYAALLKANRDNERKLAQVRRAKLTRAAGDMLAATREVGGVKVLATRVDGVDGKGLRELADKLRDKLQSGIVCVGGKSAGKATLLVAVTRDLSGRYHAGSLVKELAPLVGGRGGGKAELAQAGGSNPEAIDQVFERLVSLVGSA